MYQLLNDHDIGYGVVSAQCIKRLADNAFIPFDDANTDFVEYKKWLAEGNAPEPAETQEPQ